MPDHRHEHGNIEEAIRMLKIEKDDPGLTGYPDRPGQPDCLYYLKTGMCGYGDTCRFNHPAYNGQDDKHGADFPERVGEPDCVYFLKTGTCKYGSSCKYNHPHGGRDACPVVLNTIGLPMRQGQKSCPHYIRTGSCKFGATCKFHHPQLPLDGANTPVSGPMSYAPSHISGVPSWPYMSQQTYFPMVLPPSGTPYIGNMSPMLSTNGLTPIDHVYPSTPSSPLPERPNEPECRYFMSSGTCKYGSNCKYHHPKEKTVQSAVSSLSPFGLPLIPGQTVCSYYSLYGTCKYGSACKYDHPLVVYSYNYNMGLTSLPRVEPLFMSYGGTNSPTTRSADSTSNGKLSTDDSCVEHVGSSSHSSSQNQSD
ncbi:zinc finger C-x8-C-x5-C-x3-H type family protein [Artemisia annua]|uniref:Zinc finger C-x8-C-x5-C-x3-H type family protein n=1 Tax=Artemisia annua TaxID=35608 RepID=A0A2U1MTW4_ARTAN|nr:zinc finger C-x8-C-x5-C-x3-H type family protein [Artemisia annua]